MSTKYYAGRPIQSEGKTFYVGDVVPKAGEIRNLHNLLATGHIYKVSSKRDFDHLPPHVRKEVLARRRRNGSGSAPTNVIFLSRSGEAKEAFEKDTAVKTSRAQAELSQAYAAKVTENGKTSPDNQRIRRAAKIFGRSVLDEGVAVKPSVGPKEEEPKKETSKDAQEPQEKPEPKKEEPKKPVAKKAPVKRAPVKKPAEKK